MFNPQKDFPPFLPPAPPALTLAPCSHKMHKDETKKMRQRYRKKTLLARATSDFWVVRFALSLQTTPARSCTVAGQLCKLSSSQPPKAGIHSVILEFHPGTHLTSLGRELS